MGFGGIVTTIIMFIAVLLVATGVITVMNNNIDDSQASMRAQAELLNNQIKTNIEITQVNYTAGNVRVYVINNGKTTLKLDRIDVYLDNAFIPRNDTYRTLTLEPSTDINNPGLWDPNEILRVNISQTIASGTHTVVVATQYNTNSEELFSI